MPGENSGIMNGVPLIKHILVVEDQANRRTIILDEANYTMGRHSSNSIQMNSRQSSRHHATFVRKFNTKLNQFTYLIVDGDLEGNKSQNGIFINGEKCLIHELKDGDLINFGCDVNASYHQMGKRENLTLTSSLNSEVSSLSKQKELDSSDENIQTNKLLILSEEDTDTRKNKDSKDKEDTFTDYSYLDALTGLPNQTLFNEYLYIAVSNAKRHQHHVVVLLVDLDLFSGTNQDSKKGWADQILKDIGKTVQNRLRNGDIVARWGSSQFSILLPQIQDIANSSAIVQRILSTIHQNIKINGDPVHIQTHHAVVVYPQDADDSQKVLSLLESRLTQAKLESESVPSSSLELSHRRSQVEKRLHRAIEYEELSLSYQPQINLKTGGVEAMEAFIRWHHPQKGLIAPGKFLPWADKTELTDPINRWILTEACRQNMRWQQAGISPLVMSVNLSEKQFYHPNLPRLIEEILRETQLDPRYLEFEISESFLIQQLEKAQKIIRSLDNLGISFCLDDFGKHYASIRYLIEFPIKKIKIDQSFIAKLADNPQAIKIMSTFVDLGKNLNLQVIAKGVETQLQTDILQNLDCFLMQGYRFSQPMKGEEAKTFLLLHRTPAR
jgi:diguanylate cyclase (GGDEF)-like protein